MKEETRRGPKMSEEDTRVARQVQSLAPGESMLIDCPDYDSRVQFVLSAAKRARIKVKTLLYTAVKAGARDGRAYYIMRITRESPQAESLIADGWKIPGYEV